MRWCEVNTRRLLRFFMDKRAITPVLSNLLLMVVAVAAMSIAAATAYVITTNLREAMGERLIIEDIWFNNAEAGTRQISIYLRNVGKVPIRISTVYINHTRCPTPTLELGLAGHGWLNITYAWASNSLYHLDVVTTRGTRVGGYYKAP